MYIGQTKKSLSERAGKNGIYYKGCWCFYNAIQKYGWNNFKHIVLIDGLTKEMADIVEMELIKKYRTYNRDIGYNITLGGSNRKESKPIYQYDLNGNYVNKFNSTNEACDAIGISQSSISMCITQNGLSAGGYQWRNEYYDHIDPYKYIPTYSHHVYQYDMDGNYIKEYDSLRIASEVLNVSRLRPYVYLYDDVFHSCGYLWAFNSYGEKMDKNILDLIKWRISTHGNQKMCRMVHQYNLQCEYVASYKSVRDASINTGINQYGIKGACGRNNKYYSNYIWSYDKLDRQALLQIIDNAKKYIEIDINCKQNNEHKETIING